MATLSGGHLAVDFASGAVPALLPFIALEFDLSYTETAILMLSVLVSSSFVQPLFGMWSDRRGALWLLPGGVALAAAGAYQFTGLKDACLSKCRNPFGVLFSRWTARPSGIFRLGAEQGAWCVGCCWAMMLVMFVVGMMNVFWMALLALFALVEKQATGVLATRIAGAMLLVWAATLLVISAGPA